MAMTFTLAGKSRTLSLLVNKSVTLATMKLKLFTNQPTVSKDSVIGDFTAYTATGYAPADFDPANITVAQVGVTAEVKAQSAKITFTMTDAGVPATVYGYYLTDAAGTELIGAETFSDAPYTLGSSGGNINITLSLSLT